MIIDATFWVAVSFFIFFGILIYLKIPQKINSSLTDQINEIRNELGEAEKLKNEAKTLLSDYENKIDKSKKEAKKIIDDSKKKLDRDIENKKQEFNDEIEKELLATDKEIKDLKKSSISNINTIATETAAEVIKQIINIEVNKSSASAIVSDLVKRKLEKHI